MSKTNPQLKVTTVKRRGAKMDVQFSFTNLKPSQVAMIESMMRKISSGLININDITKETLMDVSTKELH